MDFTTEENKIFALNDRGDVIAQVLFPQTQGSIVEITSTYVSDELRGQGIAGKLMLETVITLRETKRKAVPVCSYAINYFDKHPEYSDVLA